MRLSKRRLARAARPHQRHEGASSDFEIEIRESVAGLRPGAVCLADRGQSDCDVAHRDEAPGRRRAGRFGATGSDTSTSSACGAHSVVSICMRSSFRNSRSASTCLRRRASRTGSGLYRPGAFAAASWSASSWRRASDLALHPELFLPTIQQARQRFPRNSIDEEEPLADLIAAARRHEPAIEHLRARGRDLIRNSARVGIGGIRAGADQSLVSESSEHTVEAPCACLVARSRLVLAHQLVAVVRVTVPQQSQEHVHEHRRPPSRA